MNSKVLWFIILTIGIGLVISANIFRDKGPDNISQQTPTPSEIITLSASPSQSPRPTNSPKQLVATCQIGGQIIFLNENTYENKNAKISYQNVDDVIRQIFWKSEPNDGALIVGPNLFEELPIPNGERNIGVALAKETTSKNYTLTASITYGIKRANGMIEERITDCTGKASVQMP